ncbi:hypothetical protein F5B19DRAFT_488517 [Rostrohypoxylon terebratum]|nr:hypothetical protein F5B19DRAFT_488517 [Rostrohypoxylon terebratum]
MKVLKSLLATLFLLVFGAWALPLSTDSTVTLTSTETIVPVPLVTSTGARQTNVVLPKMTSSTISVTAQAIMTLPPQPLESSTSSFTGKCEYSFCDQGTDVCFYWAGVTSWDVSRGPLPGVIPTMLGPCETGVATTRL